MSLREEMYKYEKLTGESAEHIPIIQIGAYLDGYEKGIEELENIKGKLEDVMWYNLRDKEYCLELISKRISELKGESK